MHPFAADKAKINENEACESKHVCPVMLSYHQTWQAEHDEEHGSKEQQMYGLTPHYVRQHFGWIRGVILEMKDVGNDTGDSSCNEGTPTQNKQFVPGHSSSAHDGRSAVRSRLHSTGSRPHKEMCQLCAPFVETRTPRS